MERDSRRAFAPHREGCLGGVPGGGRPGPGAAGWSMQPVAGRLALPFHLTVASRIDYSAVMKPEELQQQRERLRLTQQELAVKLGVAVMTVSKWERGIHRIPESVALLLQQMRPEKGAKSKRSR